MKIDKVMNNNVVSSIDEDGQEIIVVGTGVGFQGKEGKPVDEKKIQKIFRLEDPKMIRKLKEILQDLPMEQFEISTAIIEHAKQSLGHPPEGVPQAVVGLFLLTLANLFRLRGTKNKFIHTEHTGAGSEAPGNNTGNRP